MRIFDLTLVIKGLIGNKEYEASNGASYFIPGFSQEFNPRSDDSLFQAMFLEYNPTLYNEDEDWMDKLYEACQDLKGKAIQVFDSCMEGDCKVNGVGNGITIVTSDKAGIALTFADSDMGLYITYMETLC